MRLLSWPSRPRKRPNKAYILNFVVILNIFLLFTLFLLSYLVKFSKVLFLYFFLSVREMAPASVAFFDRKKSISRDRKQLGSRNSVREQSTLSFLSTLSEIAGNNRVLTLLETLVILTSCFH